MAHAGLIGNALEIGPYSGKVENCSPVNYAPIGYLYIRALNAHATGKHSVRTLTKMLVERELTAVPTAWPVKNLARIHHMQSRLTNAYYTCVIKSIGYPRQPSEQIRSILNLRLFNRMHATIAGNGLHSVGANSTTSPNVI